MTDQSTIAYRDEIAEQIANLVGARDTYSTFIALNQEDASVAYAAMMLNGAIDGLSAALATVDRSIAAARPAPDDFGMFPPLKLVRGNSE